MMEAGLLETIPKKREELVTQILQDLNLKNLVNVETLQNLQDNLAAVTGIAMVTVDFKGAPITKETSFSSFCQARREISQCKANCFFSRCLWFVEGCDAEFALYLPLSDGISRLCSSDNRGE